MIADVGSAVLPPMPRAAAKVLKLLNKPDTTAEDLRQIIETDPSLTTSVLRLVNSALFNLPKQISTLSHAIMLLGFLRLRSLTLASVVAGLRDLVPPEVAEKRDLIWEHSVNVALGSRHLAERAGLAWSEEAFVAGLLHDVGRLMLLASRPTEYAKLLDDHSGGMPTSLQEKEILGESHEEIGGELLKQWNLAPQLIATAGSHHGDHVFEGEHAALISVVALADRVVDKICVEEDPRPAAALLEFDDATLEAVSEEIRVAVKKERGGLIAL